MPDNTSSTNVLSIPPIPPPSPEVSYLPDTGMPKLDELDNYQNKFWLTDHLTSSLFYVTLAMLQQL
mgnify:CR=1 FL=1